MENRGLGFTRLKASGLVNEGATLLFGISILTSAATGSVAIYDGLDATTGRLIVTLVCDAAKSVLYNLPGWMLLERGLYVTLDANVTEVTLFWRPVELGQ